MWKKPAPLPADLNSIKNQKTLRFAENTAALDKAPEYIFSQNNPAVKKLHYGRYGTVGANGCGSVVLYNALRALGKPVPYPEIIYEMELNHMLRFFGKLGTSPLRFSRFLREHGADCEPLYSYSELAKRIGEFKVVIMYMQYKKSLMRHYFLIIKKPDGSLATLNRGTPTGFGSIDLSKPFDAHMLTAYCLK